MADGGAAAESLRAIKLSEARALAQHTAAGEFRPLKSAPTLRTGWRLPLANDAELAAALQHLYPGALADWHAARAANPPVTNYRDYVNRQSGMYRITAKLDDAQATGVIRAGCDRANCLKRRLWSVAGLEPDAALEKSLIPCLEPCAVLMELARKTVRELQGQGGTLAACAEPETG